MPRLPGSHRQLLLFFGAVLAPGILLVASAVREQRRGEVLARQAAAESRARSARQIANQLRLTLEQIRLDATAADVSRPEALLVARPLSSETSVTRSGAAGQRSAAAAAELRAAESAEFAGRTAEAIERYRELMRRGDRALAANAGLGLARVLARSGRAAEADSHYRAVLTLPFGLRDDEGIPLALYAAYALKSVPLYRDEVIRRVHQRVSTRDLLGSLEAHMLRDLAEALPAGATADMLRARAAAKVQEAAQLAALERDLPTLLRLRSAPPIVGAGADALWLPYGNPLWLVGAQRLRDSPDTLFMVVDAATLAEQVSSSLAGIVAGSVRLTVTDQEGTAEPLGPEFPGLRAQFTPGRLLAFERSVLAGPLLLLVLILAGVAAYLLWRDVRRESRVSALRSRFVSAVSHELKTPLTSIRMFAEMLRMERSDEQRQAAFVDTIVGESERLSRLIENVLHFARMEEGRQRYTLAPGEVQQVVRDAAQAMQYQIAQEGMRLDLDIDESVPPLPIDRDAMTHAVLNLLSNAVKFSPEGGEVNVRLERSNGSACITVSDRGVGIAPEEQTRIFEEYYRAPDAEARGIAGTGLGLALVADVARAHGGDVQLRSAPGAGSSFTLRIPLEPAQ